MAQFYKICLGLAGLACLATLGGFFSSNPNLWQPSLVVCCVAGALGISIVPALRGYQYTLWIVVAVVVAMVYPQRFLSAGPLNLGLFEIPELNFRNSWLVLVVVQLVMFGMGTKMSLRDFVGVAKMPFPVLIGISLQFLIMPLTGYTLATAFGFPPEIAAGLILIGSCSSGLASNVMCYLAGANLALSITLTAVATLLAPLATPFWMSTLAGEMVEVETTKMMINIVKIVIVPIGAAMIHDQLKQVAIARRPALISAGAAIALCTFLSGAAANLGYLTAFNSVVSEWLIIFGGALGFAIGFHLLASRFAGVENKVHLLSMMGIVYFTTVTTAAGRDNLLAVGGALLLAAILHNLVGYVLGFGMSRLCGLDKQSAITVAFEVGMQNGGMASALAGLMGKLGTVGLAAAVFSPWMNVSGSVLANLLRKFGDRPAQGREEPLRAGTVVESENVASA